jgi:hypothetical protein
MNVRRRGRVGFEQGKGDSGDVYLFRCPKTNMENGRETFQQAKMPQGVRQWNVQKRIQVLLSGQHLTTRINWAPTRIIDKRVREQNQIVLGFALVRWKS